MAKTGDPEATLVLAFVALRGGANEAQLAQDLREWEPQFGPATEANVLAWARNHPKANANVRPLNQ